MTDLQFAFVITFYPGYIFLTGNKVFFVSCIN